MYARHILKDIDTIQTCYSKSKDPAILQDALISFTEKHSTTFPVGDYLLGIAEKYIDAGDNDAEILI